MSDLHHIIAGSIERAEKAANLLAAPDNCATLPLYAYHSVAPTMMTFLGAKPPFAVDWLLCSGSKKVGFEKPS